MLWDWTKTALAHCTLNSQYIQYISEPNSSSKTLIWHMAMNHSSAATEFNFRCYMPTQMTKMTESLVPLKQTAFFFLQGNNLCPAQTLSSWANRRLSDLSGMTSHTQSLSRFTSQSLSPLISHAHLVTQRTEAAMVKGEKEEQMHEKQYPQCREKVPFRWNK